MSGGSFPGRVSGGKEVMKRVRLKKYNNSIWKYDAVFTLSFEIVMKELNYKKLR